MLKILANITDLKAELMEICLSITEVAAIARIKNVEFRWANEVRIFLFVEKSSNIL